MIDDLERAVIDAGRAEPGAELRARVLAAAMPLVRPDDSRLDRIWFSPRWRTIAALAFLALVVLERTSPQVNTWAPVARDTQSNTTVRAAVAAAQEAGLSQDEVTVIVAQAIDAERARANQ